MLNKKLQADHWNEMCYQLLKLMTKQEKDFAVLENMNAYRDEGMGDVIFGEPFLREADIKAKRIKGMITLYKGDDEVNEKDVINGDTHAYQKLKGFYKGVLNLGPDYIQNVKTEEWLTRGTSACMRHREGNIDEYWWRIYEFKNLEVLES
ncbi:hypothetical protein Tco_0617755 [Tanacetum coccineum]